MKLDKKCTIKEQETCEVEKRGCEGCYYNTDKEIEDLNDFAELLRPEQRYYTNLIKKVIEDRLKDREKIKELEEENYVQKIEIYENSIPKQKIKDKIEGCKELVEDFEKTDNTGRFKKQNSIDYYKLEAYKELLKESEDK